MELSLQVPIGYVGREHFFAKPFQGKNNAAYSLGSFLTFRSSHDFMMITWLYKIG